MTSSERRAIISTLRHFYHQPQNPHESTSIGQLAESMALALWKTNPTFDVEEFIAEVIRPIGHNPQSGQ